MNLVFAPKGKCNTTLVPLMILDMFKDLNVTARQVAKNLNVSDTYVHDTFLQFVDLPRLKLTPVISIDEVHMHFNKSDLYSLVIMDFQTKQIIDFLPNRRAEYTSVYFRSIPKEERDIVKYLVTDMNDSFIEYTSIYLKQSVNIIDSFHVIKWIIGRIRSYIGSVKRKYLRQDAQRLEEYNQKYNVHRKSIKPCKETYFLTHFNWVMLSNNDDLEYYGRKEYKALGQYLDTEDIKKQYFEINPNFKKIHELKEKYIKFNQEYINRPNEAGEALDELINLYKESEYKMFREFSDLLHAHRDAIVNSFTCITLKDSKDHEEILQRISNGPIESFNNKPKDYRRQSQGVENSEYTRNRILWSVRESPAMLAVPRDISNLKVERKKRGKYKK